MESITKVFSIFTKLLQWWVVIAPWEQAVRVRLGKHVKLLGKGVHFRIPFIDRIFIQTTRRRLVHVDTQTLTTKDNKHVTISGSLGYSIDDLLMVYETLHQPQDTIIQEVMSYVSEYIVTHDLVDCAPSAIQEHVNSIIDIKKYGLVSYGFVVIDFAVVMTVRLMNHEPNRWEQSSFNTDSSHGD